ncbi:TonB-dependent receptor [Lentimicrobium sp. S6]|uniref:TonB-dependent receptor n=1 Tax=Lentimicrobium sp. S6 TaxID=2735872 RepID=UPI00155165FF|nr:TonB-dependent receptor [Lentimicrobium sp. S6]NPD48053.1 TonB-dependent receptor [Lentimicrobium sp. S6]
MPYTAPEGGYELSLLDGTSADFINVSVKNGNRLPAYHRLDLSANYNFTFGKNSPASIGFSIFNAYNRSNVWYNEYEIIENEVIETPVYYLNFTPNINLTFKLK